MNTVQQDARIIIKEALKASLPDTAVREALENIDLSKHDRVLMVAIGKAAWQMGKAAMDILDGKVEKGLVITKHAHSMGDIVRTAVMEAGHPVPDEHSVAATMQALNMVEGLTERDAVLFLVSGGGSALFEKPKVDLNEMKDITEQLLKAGCDIVEINTVRKRLSLVKGGRFALACAPAHVYAVVLSDIIGDPLDMIASGPAYPDTSTCASAQDIVRRYRLTLSEEAKKALNEETPKALANVTTLVTGSVKNLCRAAADTARALGYKPHILTASLSCEAREAGGFLAAIARDHQEEGSIAYIAGGETVVHVKGKGKGGRNQELALSSALGIASCRNTCVFSLGSDGTDGPTDAAGGIVDEHTAHAFVRAGIDPLAELENNNAYAALKAVDALIMTGPTGTNVNDVSVVLIKR